MIGKIKKYARAAALILCGTLAACIVLEGVLQITDKTNYDTLINDPKTGLLHYRPNLTFVHQEQCFSNIVHINSMGFHAPEQPSPTKSANEYRIVVIGGSFIEGVQVPISDLFSSQLQQMLNAQPHRAYNYEVIPIGFSGNGTFLNTLYYLRYAQPLHPDLVIEFNTEYEVGRDAPNSGAPYYPHFDANGTLITTLPPFEQNSRTSEIKDFLRHSKLVMNIFNRYLSIKEALETPPAQNGQATVDSQNEALSQEWVLEQKLIRAFDQNVIATDAKFMIMSWYSPGATDPEKQALHANLTEAAANDSFAYLDLAPSIAQQASSTGESPVWPCDDHWSSAGDAFAANAVFNYLEAHPALLRH